jgi:hypothetical protein
MTMQTVIRRPRHPHYWQTPWSYQDRQTLEWRHVGGWSTSPTIYPSPEEAAQVCAAMGLGPDAETMEHRGRA